MKSNFAAFVSVLLVLAIGATGFAVLGPNNAPQVTPPDANAGTGNGPPAPAPTNESSGTVASPRALPVNDPGASAAPLPPCCGKGIGGTCSNPAQCPRLNAPRKATPPMGGPSAS